MYTHLLLTLWCYLGLRLHFKFQKFTFTIIAVVGNIVPRLQVRSFERLILRDKLVRDIVSKFRCESSSVHLSKSYAISFECSAIYAHLFFITSAKFKKYSRVLKSTFFTEKKVSNLLKFLNFRFNQILTNS